jgi:hypothetical protein
MLRLLIPPTWPIPSTSCGWALQDDDGRLIQSGHSDPRTWPVTEDCEVILSTEQCLCLEAEIPAKAGKLSDDVIVMALEEQLLGDIADEHWVIGKCATEGRVPVCLVRRQRIADVLETLRQLGRKVRRLVWEAQLVTVPAGNWVVVLEAQRGFICTHHYSAWAFPSMPPVSPLPPVDLVLSLEDER